VFWSDKTTSQTVKETFSKKFFSGMLKGIVGVLNLKIIVNLALKIHSSLRALSIRRRILPFTLRAKKSFFFDLAMIL